MIRSSSGLVGVLAFAMVLAGVPETIGSLAAKLSPALPAVSAAEASTRGGLMVFIDTPGVPVSAGGFYWDSGRGVWVQEYWSGWQQPPGQGGAYFFGAPNNFCNLWRTIVGWWWSYNDQRSYVYAWANGNCIGSAQY